MAESNAVAEIEKVANRYIAVWNEPNADSRREAVAGLWIEDGTYTPTHWSPSRDTKTSKG